MIATSASLGDDQGMELVSAILLYKSSNRLHATQHGILLADGHLDLGPGETITSVSLRKTLRELEPKTKKRAGGFVENHLLWISPKVIAWFEPSAVRPKNFTAQPELNGQYPTPPLVFIGRRGASQRTVQVYAVTDNARPTQKTRLYRAPYSNKHSQQTICYGTTELPKFLEPDNTGAWTTAYFTSAFTGADADYLAHWSALRGAKTYPTQTLSVPDKTLEEACQWLEKI